MTQTTIGKLRWELKGDHSTSTTYIANDIVNYRNQEYICIQNTAPTDAGVLTPDNTARWMKFASFFNFRGTWTTATAYKIGDVVNQATQGTVYPSNANYTLSRSVEQSYYCISDHTSSASLNPIDPALWTPMNRNGILGTQNAAGSAVGRYSLGVYSRNHFQVGVLPNRGIMYDNSPYYRGGGYKNTVESRSVGFVTVNGQTHTWGTGDNGSLGMDNCTTASSPHTHAFPFYDWFRSTSNAGVGVHSTTDNGFPRVMQWEKSYSRNLVLMNSGEVFAWGYGGNGENGNGTNSNYAYPVRVGGTLANVFTGGHAWGSIRIKRIAMSGGSGHPDDIGHALALDENGQVWAWGYNAFGQLGIGNTTAQNIPQAISKASFSGRDIVAIWAHGTRTGWSMAVDDTGALWCWGYNIQGQLGVGDNLNKTSPIQVTGTSFGASPVGTIVKINAIDRWTGTVGEGGSAILTSTGRVYITGANGSGWMGNNNTTALNSWTLVGSGPGTSTNQDARDMWLVGGGANRATMYVRATSDGVCWASGYNSRGQLARGGTATAQQTTFDKCKMSIAGALYDMVNISRLAFLAQDDDTAVLVVLDNGLAMGCGEGAVGQLSNGVLSQFQNWSDANGIEETVNYCFQLCRGSSDMIGNMQDVMGFGYDPTNDYFAVLWVNRDGRPQVNGRGNQGQTAIYNAGVVDAISSTMMLPIVAY